VQEQSLQRDLLAGLGHRDLQTCSQEEVRLRCRAVGDIAWKALRQGMLVAFSCLHGRPCLLSAAAKPVHRQGGRVAGSAGGPQAGHSSEEMADELPPRGVSLGARMNTSHIMSGPAGCRS